MKRFFLDCAGVLTLIILVCLSSCTQDNGEALTAMPNWQEQISMLNQQYQSQSSISKIKLYQAPQSGDNQNDNEGEEKEDEEELKVDWGEIALNDATGVQAGAGAGSIFGPWGSVVGAIVAGAGLSIVSYIVQSDEEAVVYNKDTLSIGSPVFGKIHLNDIDRREPITIWTNHEPMNDAIGMNMGVVHNLIINELLSNPQYQNHDFTNLSLLKTDIIEIIQNNEYYSVDISNELSEIENSSVIEDELSWLIEMPFEDKKTMLSESIVNLTECLDIAFHLDSVQMQEYACKYTEIVNAAYEAGELSEDDAFFINSVVSVGCYSRMLWRHYLPDPSFNDFRLVYTKVNDTWTFCPTDEDVSLLLCSSGYQNESIVGIPHFVHGKLAELYFYSDNLKQYGIDLDLDDFVLDIESVISFSEETKFETMGNIPDNINIWNSDFMGDYPIEKIQGANVSAYCVRFY